MTYSLTQGQTEKAILILADRNRTEIPLSIQNAPELMPGLELYWDGFKSLTTCRNAMYMSEGPIPWTAILAYCNEHDIVDEQREYFFDMISVLDVAYLELKTKKMQERQAAS